MPHYKYGTIGEESPLRVQKENIIYHLRLI